MNRKTLVLVTLGVALVVFAAAAWTVSRSLSESATAPGSAEQETRLVRPYSPVLGPEEAPVTIVEFFDPACEACRAFYPIVKDIMADHPEDVRVVLRYTAFHGEGSELAIKVLEAARLQGVYLPVLEALLGQQSIWASHGAPAEGRIMEIAAAAGLDADRAARQILMPDIVAIANQDNADVEAIGVRKTPTFFVNGKPLEDFGAKQLVALVEAEVAAAWRE